MAMNALTYGVTWWSKPNKAQFIYIYSMELNLRFRSDLCRAISYNGLESLQDIFPQIDSLLLGVSSHFLVFFLFLTKVLELRDDL